MSLSDIRNKLYKKNAPENISEYDLTKFNPKSKNEDVKEINPEAKDLWVEKKGMDKAEKKAVKWGIIALVFIILLVVLISAGFMFRKSMFSEGKVSISIIGPTQARSGKLLTYEIQYKNDNKVAMENVILKLSYPENFKPDNDPNFKEESLTSGSFNLGTIEKRSQGKTTFNGKAYSPKGALMYLKTDLIYQPASFSGQFKVNAQIGVDIDSAPIILEVRAPQNISSGDAVDYLITYRNDGTESLDNLSVKIEYPEGFVFSKADPASSEGNNVWNIGDLAENQSGKIVVSGKLEGERDNVKSVKAYLGTINQGEFLSYNEESADTKIIYSPLTIAQVVNGLKDLNVNAGDVLNFAITYKNNGNTGLRDVILTEKIDSAVLDYSSLDTNGGGFDLDSKMITWKASSIKEFGNLAPGQSGTILFRIKVKDIFPISSAKDKNFVISSLAKIDSPDIPTPISMNKIISSNELNIKVNSKLALEVNGRYDDLNIPNSGPIPPKVGQETTYSVYWKVVNVSNDVGGAKIIANLPIGAEMTGKIFPEDARITYNQRTNSIAWDIGNISAGSGVISSPLEAGFQVKIKPSPNQVNANTMLLEKSTLTAKDLFTNENLERIEKEKIMDEKIAE